MSPARPPGGAVFVGRFQPPHDSHLHSIRVALEAAPRVLVLLGSANLARSVKNPFSAPERARMLRAALRDAGAEVDRVAFRPLPDRFDTALWVQDVQAAATRHFGAGAPVALVGHEKDASTAYLQWFPDWARATVPFMPGLNATDLRAALFTGGGWPPGTPPAVQAGLEAFRRTRVAARLGREWRAVEAARAALPPGLPLHEERWLHVQGDAVWLHVRRNAIGDGLWELPGRALPPGEQPTVPTPHVFAHPARSLVAPAAAHVHLGPPPADLLARLVPLGVALARPRRFFEDHHVILTRLLALRRD